MRKSLLAVAAIICCAMAATVFTSCSKSSDDDGGTTSNTKSPRVELLLSLSESEDILKYCDVNIEYNDGTGAKTVTLTDKTWKKTLTAKLPATFSIKKTVTLKEGVDLSTDTTTFNCAEAYSYMYNILNADGGVITSNGNSTEDLDAEGKTYEVAEGIKKGDFNLSFTYAFDANGKLTIK